jgi:hypothetical protein
MAKKAVNFRIEEKRLELIDRIGRDHGIENRTAVLEWMIDKAAERIGDHDLLRRLWTLELAEEFGSDARVSVTISGSDGSVQGRPAFVARATVNGEEARIEADVFPADSGSFEVWIKKSDSDKYPSLIFEVANSGFVDEARTLSGWEGADDFLILFTRKVSDLASLPIADAPGDTTPKTRAEVGS